MRLFIPPALLAALFLSSAARAQVAPPVGVATEATRRTNAEVAASLPLTDTRDFENATRGLIAQIPGGIIRADDGRVVWDAGRYDFLEGAAPATVNPRRLGYYRPGTIARSGLLEASCGYLPCQPFSPCSARRRRPWRRQHRQPESRRKQRGLPMPRSP